jgi:enoyl-CoA hydratase/carnithine racemase
VPNVPLGELLNVAASAFAQDALGIDAGGGWVLTDLREARNEKTGADPLAHLGCVLVAIGEATDALAAAFDVVVDDEAAAAEVTNAIDARPIASTALALLLRGTERRTVLDGLIAESSTYSTLQQGPEYGAWFSARTRRSRAAESGPPVRLKRTENVLRVTLSRPAVRNAFNAAMREALLDALGIAIADDTVTEIEIDGEGTDFCSGGDLDEFGSLSDPATAHLLRVSRSAAQTLHQLRDRTTAHVHGACVGAGIELPAFAGRVIAREGATFLLPEISMGLVPGAGGTVSISRRVGRRRTAWMAITGTRVDVATALRWGLVDAVVGPREV